MNNLYKIYLLLALIDAKRAENINEINSSSTYNVSSKKYVIIDTDAGVDDALGLMLAFDYHKKGLIEILGITCSYGNTFVDNVIKNVLLTQRASGVEGIKIFKGVGTPFHQKKGLENLWGEDDVFGIDGLGNASLYLPLIDINIEREHAVLAIIRLVKEYPKQITLITLGPMTNLAMAIQLDPSITSNLVQIISMGGLLDTLGNVGPTTEFNLVNDPESVDIVLKKSDCPLTMVTLDVTYKHVIPLNIFNKIIKFGTKRSEFIEKIYELSLKSMNGNGVVLCDILCVIAFITPELITKSDVFPTAMELTGSLTRGQLVVGRSPTIPPFKGSRNVVFIEKFDSLKSIDLVSKMAQK